MRNTKADGENGRMNSKQAENELRTLDDLAKAANEADLDQKLAAMAAPGEALRPLMELAPDERIHHGYGHTVTEILQQPYLWADTAVRARNLADSSFGQMLRDHRVGSIAITGSGSSHYAAELASLALQQGTGIPVRAVAAGDLLSHGAAALPQPGPVLLVSLARSGNSPESVAAVRVVTQEAPDSHFLNITCNAEGKLAVEGRQQNNATQLVLHPRSHDNSLVMTSSFTNMALALAVIGRLCGERNAGVTGNATMAAVSTLAAHTISAMPEIADAAASLPFGAIRRAVFLGAGCQYGAAREAALKLTEMTAGRIVSMHESFLGLRHGPMAAVDGETLVVAMLPPEERSRRYAQDLLSELERKHLGHTIAVVDGSLSTGLANQKTQNTALPLPGEDLAALLGVLAGQWIGFFACRHHGLRPDAPAETGVITRVVEPFPQYH
jgi:tagatose-6-phosphate ketose/aldose isomerase